MNIVLFSFIEVVSIFNYVKLKKTKPGISVKMMRHLGSTNLSRGRRKLDCLRPVSLLREPLVSSLPSLGTLELHRKLHDVTSN